MDKPETFFKFYGLTDTSVDALRNLYVYATHPNQLNDPFDCDENIISIEKDYENANCLWRGQFDEILEAYGNDENEAYKFTQGVLKTILYKKWGVLSLTTSQENPLLWSYYTDNKGFCVEWDIDKFPFRTSGPFPVNYQKDLCPISTRQAELPCSVLIQCNVKNVRWQHEDEWRLMIYAPPGLDMKGFGKAEENYNASGDHDRKFHYPLSALKSVTLGVNFFEFKYITERIDSEIMIVYPAPSHNTEVLAFLASVPVKSCLAIKKNLNDLQILPIKIIKINDLQYYIVEESR